MEDCSKRAKWCRKLQLRAPDSYLVTLRKQSAARSGKIEGATKPTTRIASFLVSFLRLQQHARVCLGIKTGRRCDVHAIRPTRIKGTRHSRGRGSYSSGAAPKQRNPTAVVLSEKGLRVVACSLRLNIVPSLDFRVMVSNCGFMKGSEGGLHYLDSRAAALHPEP